MTVYRPLIVQIAEQFGIDPNLLEAVVIAESNACTDAFRFEEAFWNRYMKGKPAWIGANPRRVSSSYGLCQVMYPTAKDAGFGDLPELLFVPDVGLKFGAMQLRKMLRLCDGDVRWALASYNGGYAGRKKTTPRAYAERVLKLYEKVKEAHP